VLCLKRENKVYNLSMTMRIPTSSSYSSPKTPGSFDHLGSHVPMGRPSVDSDPADLKMKRGASIDVMGLHSFSPIRSTNTFSIRV
jgi:hypothetical protein